MGDIADDIVFQGLDAAEFFHHLVEILEHDIDVVVFVLFVDRGDRDAEIPLGNRFGGLAQHLHGLVEIIFLLIEDNADDHQGNDRPETNHRKNEVDRHAVDPDVGIINECLPDCQANQN